MGSEKELFTLDKPHGSGDILICWQRGRSGFLATAGSDYSVFIYNRIGQKCEHIKIRGPCVSLAWDPEGDILAIITANSHLVTLWDSHTMKQTQVDTGLRDTLSCMMWAKTGQVLAVGSSKGNLTIYNHNTSKRIPVLGKHTRKITAGAWNASMILGLCSEDKTISLSNIDGDTLKSIGVRGDPSSLTFSEMKLDERFGEDTTVSVLVGKKTLFLFNMTDPDNPVELAFQPRYGNVVTYEWFDDGYILLGFSAGFFVAISTHIKEVGQELFQIKNHKEHLSDIALNPLLRKVASAGDNQVKIHNMSNLQEVARVISLDEETSVDKLAWSDDGQLLAVTSKSGSVFVYLSKLSVLAVAYKLQVAVLTSLTEVTIYSYEPEEEEKPEETYKLDLLVEPSVIAIGPFHAVASMNNLAYFYDLMNIDDSGPLLMREQEYLSSIMSIKLNKEFCSVMCEATIQLHMIEISEDPENDERETILFPDENTHNVAITCHALTNDFLIYGTDLGMLHYFYLNEWKQTIEWKHDCGIKEAFPDIIGRRVAFIDEKNAGYVYNALEHGAILIEGFPNSCAGIIWDNIDKNIFIAYDETTIYTYVHVKSSIYGSQVKLCGTTKLASQDTPLLLNRGHTVTVKSGGNLGQLLLSTHMSSFKKSKMLPVDKLLHHLPTQLKMCRFDYAYKMCQLLDNKESWTQLGEAALKCLRISLALRIYRLVKDAGMVLSLESLKGIQNKALISGHVAMFLHEFDIAQKWYLESENPGFALDMRKDLLHWEQALQLAENLAVKEVPFVASGFAQQLEFTGNFAQALMNYERGLVEVGPDVKESHLTYCRAGIARTAIRCGDTRRGVTIACEPGVPPRLKKECADILEEMKLLSDAAILYEKGGFVDRAASAYIQLKNWAAVKRLLPDITSTKIHLQYAKACESDRRYKDALVSYENAKDIDSQIRIYLDHFDYAEKAVQLVKENYSMDGAKMIAKYFQSKEDYSSAIRFLIYSGCTNEAFTLARQHRQLNLLGEILISYLTVGEKPPKPGDFLSLAKHYDTEKDSMLAGKYYFYAREFHKSLFHLTKASSNPADEFEALSMCIDAVSSAKDDLLTKQLIDFLLGEIDGIPKDAKYIFRLYMAQRQFKEASKTAVIMANDEQIRGNYRSAHDVLLGLYQDLRHEGLSVPAEMRANLTLLHLYTLVRLHVKKGNHMIAARLLVKVAENISKFPAHVVPILTSTVIECSRAGLKQAAFSYAAMLMRPEYRSQLDPKYARKMETVVRKPPKVDNRDPIEETSPCPVCTTELPNTELQCSNCKTALPFCLATGRHIVKGDFTACPHCDFPAIYTALKVLVEADEPCPMCSELIYPERLSQIHDMKPYLYSLAGED